MNRKLPFILIGLALLSSLIYSQRATLAIALMERVAEQRLGQDALADLTDGLHVVLCLLGHVAAGDC